MFTKKVVVVVNPIAQHQAISDDAFSLFKTTIDKLTDADTLIDGDIQKAQDKIVAAKEEKDALVKIRSRNSDLNKKISKFFGE